MGERIFLPVLNMSFTGALVTLAVLILRRFFRKSPKALTYCLWAVVFIRLLCPVSFSLPVSLPEFVGGRAAEDGAVSYFWNSDRNADEDKAVAGDGGAVGAMNAVVDENATGAMNAIGDKSATDEMNTAVGENAIGDRVVNVTGDNACQEIMCNGSQLLAPMGDAGTENQDNMTSSSAPMTTPKTPSSRHEALHIFAMVWAAGSIAMLLYGVASLLVVLWRVRDAHRAADIGYDTRRVKIYEKEGLATPFVVGIIMPRIYLPSGIGENERKYIVLHEQIHVKRGDNIFKLISYIALCLHWFNPIVWLAYFISGDDMEMSCDEAVIGRIGGNVKKEYSASLLNYAAGRQVLGITPTAFGTGDTGRRIHNVLGYEKPRTGVVCISFFAVIAASVFLLGNPITADANDMKKYAAGKTDYEPDSAAGRKDHKPDNATGEPNYASGDAVGENVCADMVDTAFWIRRYALPKKDTDGIEDYGTEGYNTERNYNDAACIHVIIDGGSFIFNEGRLVGTKGAKYGGRPDYVEYVEGCQEQAIIFDTGFDIDVILCGNSADGGKKYDAGKEDGGNHFWYICFAREGSGRAYLTAVNMWYYTKEEALEIARSIYFKEEAWDI